MDLHLIEKIIRDCERSMNVRENHPDQEPHFYIGYLLSSLKIAKSELEIFRKYALLSAENVL